MLRLTLIGVMVLLLGSCKGEEPAKQETKAVSAAKDIADVQPAPSADVVATEPIVDVEQGAEPAADVEAAAASDLAAGQEGADVRENGAVLDAPAEPAKPRTTAGSFTKITESNPKPTVKYDYREDVHTIDQKMVKKIVNQNKAAIRYCYEQELMKDKNLRGRVSVTFDIDAKGDVTSAKVTDSSLKNAAVERCLTDLILRWKFPDGTPTTVTYPFMFEIE